MNILGNALKYTQKGMIVVKLALDELDEDAGAEEANERMLEVKITDTGKGISSEYLRTSLYTRMLRSSGFPRSSTKLMFSFLSRGYLSQRNWARLVNRAKYCQYAERFHRH